MKKVLNNRKVDSTTPTNIYEYRQNNSGGSFVYNDNLTERVFIEAHDENHADSIAEDLGIYFNGCAIGYDCDCCGDRWHRSYGPVIGDEGKKNITPLEIEDYVENNLKRWPTWTPVEFPGARIFFLNGNVVEFFENEN